MSAQPRRIRTVLLPALAAATVLVAGMASAAAAPSPSPSPSPSRVPRVRPPRARRAPPLPNAANQAAKTAAKNGIVCTTDQNGHLVNCPVHVPDQARPTRRAETRATGRPCRSNLAAFVDTRTWTTGGGNTFPGAIAPWGEVQWSPDTVPEPQRRWRLQLRRHVDHRLLADPRQRPGLRRRR